MRNRLIFLAIIVLLTLSSVLAVENDCIYYFYGTGCEGCKDADDYLAQLQVKYPELQVRKYDVYYELENLKLLESYFKAYSVPSGSQGLPIVFMPQSYFVGTETIKSHLEVRILDNTETKCPALEDAGIVGVVGKSAPQNALETLTFFKVAGSAVKDSLNPIVLIILITLLLLSLGIKNKEQLLNKGFIFIIAVFIVNLLFGFGFFSWFGYSGVSFTFSKIFGFIALVISLITIIKFFTAKKKFSEEGHDFYSNFIKAITSKIAVFIWGIIAALFSFSALSGTFFLVRSLFTDSTTRWKVFHIIIFDCLIFVIPSIIILLFLYSLRKKLEKHAQTKGTATLERERWSKHNLKVMNFVLSLVILILALILLFSWESII